MRRPWQYAVIRQHDDPAASLSPARTFREFFGNPTPVLLMIGAVMVWAAMGNYLLVHILVPQIVNKAADVWFERKRREEEEKE